MVYRDRARGEKAQREIKTQSGNDAVDLLLADLSSQQSIRQFADIFRQRYTHTLLRFIYDAELDAIDIGGLNMGETQKYRNVAHNGLASFVIDDVLPPFRLRGIEIRGHVQALPDGGQQISPDFSPALIRLTPGRIISWNLTSGDPAQTHSARNV